MLNKFRLMHIEAARAGAEGRGFSIVASEIRKLAEQSKNSNQSNSVATSVQNVHDNSKNVVLAISKTKDASEAIFIASQEVAATSKQENTTLEEIHIIAEKLYQMSTQLKNSIQIPSQQITG